MHVSHCRPAIVRTLFLLGVVPTGLIASSATSFGAVPQDGSAATSSAPVTTVGGMTVTTIAWVVVGLAFLLIGLFAASKSGRSAATDPSGDAARGIVLNAAAAPVGAVR